ATHPPSTEIYTLSLHDALPISERLQAASAPSTTSAPVRTTQPRRERSRRSCIRMVVLLPSEGELEREGHCRRRRHLIRDQREERSEEHTSELQSRFDLVCRLLL